MRADDELSVTASAAARRLAGRCANTRVYVLDAGLQPVPVGVAGELYIAGAGLARGYLGRRWSDRRSGSWRTRSGQRAADVSQRGPGALACGRRAGVPGAGGQPGEGARVPDRAGRDRGGAAGVMRELRRRRWWRARTARALTGGQRLVGYVVAAAGAQVDAAALRAHVGGCCPTTWCRRRWWCWIGLPLTAEREARPARAAGAGARAPAPDGRGAAHARRRRCCAQLFAEVLGVERVGIDDRLLRRWAAIRCWRRRLISRVRAMLGVELPIRSLFEAPTVAQACASALRRRAGERRVRRCVRGAASGGDCRCRSRSSGCGSWSSWRAVAPTYNDPAGAAADGRAGPCGAGGGARATWSRGTRALRTRVPGRLDGVAAAGDRGGGCGAGTRLRGLAGRARRSCRGAVAERWRTRFDLAREPPLRAQLFELAAQDEHVLLLVLHHIAGDGWSLAAAGARPGGARTRRGARARRRRWQPLPVQYADYALWQRELLGGESDPASVLRGSWRTGGEQLAGLPERADAAVRPAASGGGELPRASRARCSCRRRLHGALLELARASGRDAVHGAAGRACGAAAPAGRGRRHPDRHADRRPHAMRRSTIWSGSSSTRWCCATDLSGDPSFRELLGRVRRDGAWRPTRIRTCRSSGWSRSSARRASLSRHPAVPGACCVLQNDAPGAWSCRARCAGAMPSQQRRAKFDLSLALRRSAGEGCWTGAVSSMPRDLFDARDASSGLARPSACGCWQPWSPTRIVRSGGWTSLGAQERERVLRGWNATAQRRRRGPCCPSCSRSRQRARRTRSRWCARARR